MSLYPRDEFDEIPESASRQGVHRERLVPPRSSGLGLKILVGVLALVVGLAAFLVLPRLGLGSGGESAPAPSTTSAVASTDQTPPASGESEAPATSEATGEASADSEPTATENADGIDRTQPVNVLNASGIEGQAAMAAGRVAADGWTIGEIASWGGAVLQNSVIFYNDASQRAAAEELGGVLGIPSLVETTEVSANITVVIGPGF